MAKDVRLQKMLADCGVASRRKAEEMIANGRVKVNGRVAKIGDKVDTKKDKIDKGKKSREAGLGRVLTFSKINETSYDLQILLCRKL